MVGWRGWAAGAVALVAVACGGGAGGGSASRQSGAEAGTGGDAGSADAGQSPAGPGSDDGGAVTDAGTGGSGGSDAGGTGGGPGTDGGTSGQPDGGSGDGGMNGPVACGTPAPAGVCQRLNPRLGAPVVHQEMENPDPFEGVACGSGAYPASGTGVVLHRMEPNGRPPRLDFVDRTGAQIGTDTDLSDATFEIDVIPQATGFGIFNPYVGGIGIYPLALLDDHGKKRGRASGYTALELPGSGVAVFSSGENAPGCGQQSRVRVQRFEDDGSPALPDSTDLGCYAQTPFVVMAGNGAGNVLVLTSRNTPDHTGWDGIWLDAQLREVSRFSTPELSAAPNNKDFAVAALLDGSFVLRSDGKWLYRIEPGTSSVEPAPCWLTARPGTEVHVTRDRNAYALVHPGAQSCDAALELMTPQGESCGPVGPLESGSDTCDVAIGRDGTISGSAYAADAGAGQPRACVLKFWPAALGPTDF